MSCSLAGALGLEKLTEALIGALAEAAGVSQPAAPGTPAEAKQVAALEGLLQLAMGPRAGLLGSGWVLVLRTLSALEALQVRLMFISHNTLPWITVDDLLSVEQRFLTLDDTAVKTSSP